MIAAARFALAFVASARLLAPATVLAQPAGAAPACAERDGTRWTEPLLRPFDDGDTHPGFAAFRREVRAIVVRRDVEGAQLIGIDDLGRYVVAAHSERRAVVPIVERIIDEEIAMLRERIVLRSDGAARKHHAQAAVAAPLAV